MKRAIMKFVECILRFSLIAIPGLIVPYAWAQTTQEQAKSATEHAHLVGHEDALLMKRIEDALKEWDPRGLDSPYLKTIATQEGKKFALRRPDLAEFIADPDAAVALGKALFWEMQAGSDFGKEAADGRIYGTACASCHYRFGVDARSRHTRAIAYQAWDKFFVDRTGVFDPGADHPVEKPPFTQRKLSFEPDGQTDMPRNAFGASGPGLLQHEIVGSQGIVLQLYTGIGTDGYETSNPISKPALGYGRPDMFVVGDIENGGERVRQVTVRNSPSVINAVFNDRQFHDGRSESTFNGFSVFGDFDKRVVLKKAFLDKQGNASSFQPVSIAVVNASLASQAVGPIVNEVEMSYLGRTFHDLALRLLKAQPLPEQTIDGTDGILGPYSKANSKGLFDPSDPSKTLTYRRLIQKAFRKEWWADEKPLTSDPAYTGHVTKAREIVAEKLRQLPAEHATLQSEGQDYVSPTQTQYHFPAQAFLLYLSQYIEQMFPSGNKPDSIEVLLEAANRWNAIEGEILPLRTAVVEGLELNDALRISRMRADEAMADALTEGPNALKAKDDLMVNNFSLYWGVSIMLYESTLISNDSPFDQMLRGKPDGIAEVWNGMYGQTMAELVKEIQDPDDPNKKKIEPKEPDNDDEIRKAQLDKLITRNAPPVLNATGMFQRGLRVFVLNCAECHEPPFFTSAANLELEPELPDPIAKLHSHALVRNALADAFKERLVSNGQAIGVGVTQANRHLLGNRKFFFDQERIPEVEAAVADLMIENMEVPDRRPISFNTVPTFPGGPALNRNPMITWLGTRPRLEYAPSPQPGEPPLDPYAFYDLGFYNIGVSEPRYDWGVWGFSGVDVATQIESLETFALENPHLIPADQVPAIKSQIIQRGNAESIPSLGSAYRLPKSGREQPRQESKRRGERQGAPAPIEEAVQAANTNRLVDHSAERGYLNGATAHARGEEHFFKRARRMVMTEAAWGHRKPFISDNELMGWGAFKTPSLRNVALTEPYMHNGRFLTLRQVLTFYSFDNLDLIPAHIQLNPDLHPEIGRLPLNSDGLVNGLPGREVQIPEIQDSECLLFFLHCLTDKRVYKESAPFDHPSIHLPNGFSNNNPTEENVISISAVGAAGNSASPQQFPSNQ